MKKPHVWSTENTLIKNPDGTVTWASRTLCVWCREARRPDPENLGAGLEPCPTRNRVVPQEPDWL